MKHGPFEDVFPIEHGDIPLLCLITGVFIDHRNLSRYSLGMSKKGTVGSESQPIHHDGFPWDDWHIFLRRFAMENKPS